jgi:hypothetical protein
MATAHVHGPASLHVNQLPEAWSGRLTAIRQSAALPGFLETARQIAAQTISARLVPTSCRWPSPEHKTPLNNPAEIVRRRFSPGVITCWRVPRTTQVAPHRCQQVQAGLVFGQHHRPPGQLGDHLPQGGKELVAVGVALGDQPGSPPAGDLADAPVQGPQAPRSSSKTPHMSTRRPRPAPLPRPPSPLSLPARRHRAGGPRGHDELAAEGPENRRVAVAFDELALAI